MRWRDDDDGRLDGEVAGALLALDATLAGDPVDPEYAELAELALILRSDRPAPDAGFATALDQRVARRFARPAQAGGAGARRWWRGSGTRWPGRWLYGSGAAAALGVCVAVLVALSAGHGGGSGAASASASSSAAAGTALSPDAREIGLPRNRSAHAPSRASGAKSAALSPRSPASGALGAPTTASGSNAASLGAAPASVPSSKRQVVQSAQLQLSAAPNRIDDVAQQVFTVVDAEAGIVNRSSVTATGNANGGAEFQLSVPSANVPATLSALSRLRGANVVSRTDATADITGQVGGAGQRLAEARALRRSLLRQLADATTTEQVDSLKLQLRDADASIASRLSTLRGLKRQVAYSRIAVSIQAATPPPVAHGSSFTIGRAAHDAKRVLVVVAGGALIALAVLVPVVLVAALIAWVGLALRRRRREQALDQA